MAEANPTTMEMLCLPEDCIITTTPAFETLVAHRDMFITQRAVESHPGYAVSWRTARTTAPSVSRNTATRGSASSSS